MSGEITPLFRPGHHITCRATANVMGKRFVGVSATRADDGLIQVATAAAGSKALGIAAHDASAGQLVTVLTVGVVPIPAGANITAGAQVEVDATGRAAPLDEGRPNGLAIENGTTGSDLMVALA